MKNPFESLVSKSKSTIEKGKLFGLGVITFLASCSGPEAPSNQTIREYFAKNPDAERIDVKEIQDWSKTVSLYKESGKSELDFPGQTPVDEIKPGGYNIFHYAVIENDSTIFMYESYPKGKEQSKMENEIFERKYILHSNGDVEIKEGYFSGEKQEKDESLYSVTKADGETGGIVYYNAHDTFNGGENYFRLAKDGTMDIGAHYYSGDAQTNFHQMGRDMDEIKALLKNKTN